MLAMLFAAYAFNFVDRQILAILAVPIKAELGLSDRALGMVGGLAFALFYTALAVPVARLADRHDRGLIVSASLALWSGFTALCGAVTGFWQLFVCRLGVGVGEAGGVAPAHALIVDLFAPAERARAFAIYSFGVPIGSALGILAGGWIAASLGWRNAFVAVGLAGLALAPAARAVLRDPRPRGAAGGHTGGSLGTIVRTPVFWLLALGAAAASIAGYAILFWMASFLSRSHGLGLRETALCNAAIVLIGGLAGIWAGGVAGDRLSARRPAALALIPAAGFALALPCYAVGLLTPSLPLAILLLIVPQGLGLLWLAPTLAAVQRTAPDGARATAAAAFLFVTNLIGLGLGSWMTGVLSDAAAARFGADSLRWAMLGAAGFYLPAIVLFAAAAARLRRA
jgi:predicted MFS family arabinose efflux permease